MTKPDEALIYRMVKLQEKDAAVGDKTAARIVSQEQGLKGQALDTQIERLRKKIRLLRRAGKLPPEPPVPKDFLRNLDRAYEEMPKAKRARQEKLAEYTRRLESLGIEIQEDISKQLKELDGELRNLQTLLYHDSGAHRLYLHHPESKEEALAKAREFAKRLEIVKEAIVCLQGIRATRR